MSDAMASAGTLKEHAKNLRVIEEGMAKKIATTGVKLLWGTANLFSHPRYAGGASTARPRGVRVGRGSGALCIGNHASPGR